MKSNTAGPAVLRPTASEGLRSPHCRPLYKSKTKSLDLDESREDDPEQRFSVFPVRPFRITDAFNERLSNVCCVQLEQLDVIVLPDRGESRDLPEERTMATGTRSCESTAAWASRFHA